MTSTAGENALRIKKKPASLGLNSLGNDSPPIEQFVTTLFICRSLNYHS